MARPPKTRTLIAAGLALWLAAVGVRPFTLVRQAPIAEPVAQ